MEKSMSDNGRVLLSDMIDDLRQELKGAALKGAGDDLVFEIEKAEIEAQVLVSKTGKGEGKVEFWVVSAGGGYEQKGETTHTVRLTLLPKSGKTGNPTIVRGETQLEPAPY
jgi:hypothetical protein